MLINKWCTFIIVADMHSQSYGSPPVSSVDYITTLSGKPYGDSYCPPPEFGDVEGSPRRQRYVSLSVI